MRILLLGEYRPLLKPLKQGLEEEGYTVDVGSGRGVGPAEVRTGAYDVVLLDLMGPADLGESLVQRWRRAGVKTPVLVLAAPDGCPDPVCAFHPGADDWLGKPFQWDELLPRLSALVRRAAVPSS
jgi:two-component system OmpR family response regulator